MAKTKVQYILGACFLSGSAAILTLVSLGTQNWVQSDAELTSTGNNELSEINYGLFSGLYKQNYGVQSYYKLEITCLFGENVCALLCGNTAEDRKEELEKLYNQESVSFNTNCPKVNRLLDAGINWPITAVSTRSGDYSYQFLNAGVWLSTIIFLIISSLFGLFAAGLSVWNIAANPVEALFNIFGLYIYNGVACLCSLLVVLLWGGMFASTITNNIAILYTITGAMDSHGLAVLGYSYWLILVAFILYGCSIALLYVRQYLLNKEPQAADIKIDDSSDPAIYLY